MLFFGDMRSWTAACLVLIAAALTSGALSADGPVVEHDPVDCIVAGHYLLLPACFRPADQVARGRVYFQPEGAAAWYFVEMKSSMPCWAGVLPKPSRALIGRHVNYYHRDHHPEPGLGPDAGVPRARGGFRRRLQAPQGRGAFQLRSGRGAAPSPERLQRGRRSRETAHPGGGGSRSRRRRGDRRDASGGLGA